MGQMEIHGRLSLPKNPKSVVKRLTHGHSPRKRLNDSIENHIGQKGILGCLFVPKSSKIRQELAELNNFPPKGCMIPLRTTWDKRGSLGVYLHQKDPKSVKK